MSADGARREVLTAAAGDAGERLDRHGIVRPGGTDGPGGRGRGADGDNGQLRSLSATTRRTEHAREHRGDTEVVTVPHDLEQCDARGRHAEPGTAQLRGGGRGLG